MVSSQIRLSELHTKIKQIGKWHKDPKSLSDTRNREITPSGYTQAKQLLS